MTIGDRLKQWRAATGAGQKEFCAQIGVPLRTYQKYEMGSVSPGADAMEAFARAGLNANWLLLGEGEMHREPQAQPVKERPEEKERTPAVATPDWRHLSAQEPAPPLDARLLTIVIETVEEFMAREKVKIHPAKKAEIIGLIYDYLRDTKSMDQSVVNRILSLTNQ